MPDIKTEKKAVAIGDKVSVVTAAGESLPAKVTKVVSPKLVDLEFEFREEPMVITSSPLDESGKRPDSWH